MTTKMSAISIRPAFMIWMVSPDSGMSTTRTVSVVWAISSSDCPTPTVSMMMICLPPASRILAASRVVRDRPPITRPALMLRKKIFQALSRVFMRTRSPSRAPPLKGLVGSTAIIPTEYWLRQNRWTSLSTNVLLPAPGGPVTPMV